MPPDPSSVTEINMQAGSTITLFRLNAAGAARVGNGLKINLRRNGSFRYSPAMLGVRERPDGDAFLPPRAGALEPGSVSFDVHATAPGATNIEQWLLENDTVTGMAQMYEAEVDVVEYAGLATGKRYVFTWCHKPRSGPILTYAEDPNRDVLTLNFDVAKKSPTISAIPGGA